MLRSNSIQRVLDIIENHADLLSHIIIKDFAPKRKVIAVDSCKAIKAALRAIFDITKSFEIFVASSPEGFSAGSVFSLAVKLVEEFGDSAKDHVEDLLLEKPADGITKIPTIEWNKKHIHDLCAIEESRRPKEGKRPMWKLGHHEKENKDFPAQNAFLFKKHIIKASASIRETISRIFEVVVRGNALDHPEVNHLFELMSRHDWSDDARRLHESFDIKYVFLHSFT